MTIDNDREHNKYQQENLTSDSYDTHHFEEDNINPGIEDALFETSCNTYEELKQYVYENSLCMIENLTPQDIMLFIQTNSLPSL